MNLPDAPELDVVYHALSWCRQGNQAGIMDVPISICLDDDVCCELEAQAHARDIGLEALLRELATQAA